MPEVFGSNVEGSALLRTLVPRRARAKDLEPKLCRLVSHPMRKRGKKRRSHDKRVHGARERRYRMDVPDKTDAPFVWALGQALSKCRVLWMRGTVMLYAFGHLDHLVGVYGTAGERLVPYRKWFLGDMWKLPSLAGYCDLDLRTTLLEERRYLRFDPDYVLSLYEKYGVAPPAGDQLDDTVILLGTREISRRSLAKAPSAYTNVLNAAWREWKQNKFRDSDFSQELRDVVLIARSNIEPEPRARMVRERLKWWYDVMELELGVLPQLKSDVFTAASKQAKRFIRRRYVNAELENDAFAPRR